MFPNLFGCLSTTTLPCSWCPAPTEVSPPQCVRPWSRGRSGRASAMSATCCEVLPGCCRAGGDCPCGTAVSMWCRWGVPGVSVACCADGERTCCAPPLLESQMKEPRGMGMDLGGGCARQRRGARFGRGVGDGGSLLVVLRNAALGASAMGLEVVSRNARGVGGGVGGRRVLAVTSASKFAWMVFSKAASCSMPHRTRFPTYMLQCSADKCTCTNLLLSKTAQRLPTQDLKHTYKSRHTLRG